MKTIKTLALSIATLAVSVTYGQLGLGVASTTQAATSATVNTVGVVQATQATTNAAVTATKTAVTAVTTKAADVRANTAATLNATGSRAVGVTKTVNNTVKSNADVNAGV